MAQGVRLALVSLPSGYLFFLIEPSHCFSWLQVAFITGFGLLALVVGCRVVFGHSGQSAQFHAPLWLVRVIILLVIVAMLTRVS